MPLPSSPRDLQIEVLNGVTYQYNASLNAWIRYKSTTANVITTDTANIVSTLSSTSTTTGALKVAGGAGITGNVFAGAVYTNSYFYANGAAFAGAGGGGANLSAVTQSIIPDSLDLYDIGSASKPWRYGYFSTVLTNQVTDVNGNTIVGFAGSRGFTGSVGSQGTTGFTGSFGSTGFVGSAGFLGSFGYTGSLGYTGSGATGYTGSAGAQGTIGYTGSAGTGGGGGGGYTGSAGIPGTLASGQATNTFTGDGTTTAFTLSVAPVSKDAVTVNIDGVTQQRSGFSVSGFVLTLDEAPLSGEVIEVTIATYGTTNFVTRTYTGNGSTANYAVTLGATVDSVIVTENGVVQTPTSDYTITGNVLSFVGGAPAAGTAIGIREIPAGAVGGNSVYSRTAITATAGQTSFAVAYTVGFLAVYFNGALLNSVDYTATNGSTVVLTDPAADGDIVEFITYNVVPVTAVPVATFNSTNLTANLAITAGYSAVSVGPINIANGVTVSIADGQKWVIL